MSPHMRIHRAEGVIQQVYVRSCMALKPWDRWMAGHALRAGSYTGADLQQT